MLSFICDPCKIAASVKTYGDTVKEIFKKAKHQQCKGSTWCDCQHRIK